MSQRGLDVSAAGSESLRVLIAGGAGGVGLACAEAFAARGAELILTDCDGVALTRAAGRLGAFSRYCDAIGDISVELFAEEMKNVFPSIDVLINACGNGYIRTLAMTRMTSALLPLLRRAQGARLIVNMASGDALASTGGMFPYASSPEAFRKLSDMFREELRGTGIDVVLVAPTLLPACGINERWSDRLYRLRLSDELDTAERIVTLVKQARPNWGQRPPEMIRRA
jgi:NAD(P)-dependent dehydrogenase (short-subunit alcohol dehydrogenase family)